jgi:hypothetical protein
MRNTRRFRLVTWTSAALVLPALLVAQWQVNPQVNRGGAPSASPGAVRYSTSLLSNSSVAMPSQVRYQAFTSGATPSSIRMTAAAVGPLAPSGAIAYIPPAPNYRTSAPVAGNYVNLQAGPAPVASSWSAYPSASMGSVRYTPPTSFAPAPGISSSVSVSPFSAIQPSSVSGGVMMGSVKYSQ